MTKEQEQTIRDNRLLLMPKKLALKTGVKVNSVMDFLKENNLILTNQEVIDVKKLQKDKKEQLIDKYRVF